MMQFLETPGEPMPDMMTPQLYLGSSASTLNPDHSSLAAFTAPFAPHPSSLSTAPFKAKPPSLPAPFPRDSSSLSTMLAPKPLTSLTSTQSTVFSSIQKAQTAGLPSTMRSQPNNMLASNLGSSTDPLATFGAARIGRFSASMSGFFGASKAGAPIPDMTSGIGLGSGLCISIGPITRMSR